MALGPSARPSLRLNFQGGLAGQQCMPFLNLGSAEECHDAVAQGVDDGSAELLRHPPHDSEGGCQAPHGLFGVKIGDELGRGDDIYKKDSDRLELLRARGFFRRIRRTGRIGYQRRATLAAEPRVVGAGRPQRGQFMTSSRLHTPSQYFNRQSI